MPFLVRHGLLDDKLPVEHARATRQLLSGLPVRLAYHETEGGHGIGSEALQRLAAWLEDRLSPSGIPSTSIASLRAVLGAL